MHSYQIWERLNHHFLTASMARSLDLKSRLTNNRNQENQSMEAYLREIKVLSDSLVEINNPLSDQELLQYALFRLDGDYVKILLLLPLILVGILLLLIYDPN